MTETTEKIDFDAPSSNPDAMQKKALRLVQDDFNAKFLDDPIKNPQALMAQAQDFYIVWFAKVLGNWKALVSTDLMRGQYWEVTHNGNKDETYVDHYNKVSNRAFSDAGYNRRYPLG